ncbi:MAG TPA: ATP-binding protein [Verrucomicrobiae bacterium]|nr:ATP-binding protein [Verrucomicrobiae bacterium]
MENPSWRMIIMGVAERSVTLRNQLSEIERLSHIIDEFAEQNDLPVKAAYELNVVMDELLTNTISYGYPDKAEHNIELEMRAAGGVVTLVLSDDAIAFNPLDRPEPDISKPAEEREIGGLGIFFVRKMMDKVEYARAGDRNVITLTKTFKPAA